MRHERRRQLAYEVQRLSQRGQSQRQIAGALGLARRTVRGLLKELKTRREQGESALDREVQPRTPRPSKLDDFEQEMRRWLEEDKRLTAVRCHEKLLEKGFLGGYTIVRERLREVRREVTPAVPATTPVTVAPGQRGEFDWSPYTIGKKLKVQLFHAALRWSRASSLVGESDTRQTTTFRCVCGALEEWGGVPLELLTDSMPGVVDRWECGEPILNARWVDVAAHYQFTALVAARGHAKGKPIAERRFRFHEENMLPGRRIETLEDYRELLAWWKREKVMKRPHPETGRPIAEMLLLERAHLKPLPAHPYDTRDVLVRLVDDYQRVHVDTNHYPVPAAVGSRVYVCADVARLEICDAKARRLIEHERLPAGAGVKLPPIEGRRSRYDLDELVLRVGLWGDVAAAYAGSLRTSRRFPGPELARILQLAVNWSADDIVAAMEHAAAYRCYEVTKLERILEARFSPRRLEDLIAESTRRRIQEVMQSHPVSQRPLESYESLRAGDRPQGASDETQETREDGDGNA